MSELPEEPTLWDKLNDFCLKLSLTILATTYVAAYLVMMWITFLMYFHL